MEGRSHGISFDEFSGFTRQVGLVCVVMISFISSGWSMIWMVHDSLLDAKVSPVLLSLK